MKWKSFLSVICATVALVFPLDAMADDEGPVIKEWTVMEKDDEGKDKEVVYMTIDGILVHETDPAKKPQPRVVAPGGDMTRGEAPSDAVILFNGANDLSGWVSTKDGGPTKWIVQNGYMIPTKDAGPIKTKQEFGSCQLHVEFATPAVIKNKGQGRGNSGVFLMAQYEIQVLDSYENTTYPDGQAAALYGRKEPLVNSSRKPGEWQTFDIVFHRPIFKNGEVVKRATFTVFHNGVLVHDNYELSGGTGWRGKHAATRYVPHDDKGPLELQDHGYPVVYRNIWIRELED